MTVGGEFGVGGICTLSRRRRAARHRRRAACRRAAPCHRRAARCVRRVARPPVVLLPLVVAVPPRYRRAARRCRRAACLPPDLGRGGTSRE